MKQIDWKSFEYFIPQIEHLASINKIRKVIGNVMIATLPAILFFTIFLIFINLFECLFNLF